jgi:hypothetical protein
MGNETPYIGATKGDERLRAREQSGDEKLKVDKRSEDEELR